jgi:hypothetical protein
MTISPFPYEIVHNQPSPLQAYHISGWTLPSNCYIYELCLPLMDLFTELLYESTSGLA